MSIGKYFQVFKISWENGFVYRLNFIMWRVRSLIQLLMLFFLWSAVTRNQTVVFGYTQAEILTYTIIGNSILRALVMGSRSTDVQGDISRGDLNNYLVKPIKYFRYWISRDFADKILNIIFVVFELSLLILIFKPPLFLQKNILLITFFGVASVLAMVLYFYISLLISMSVFWYPEHGGWAQRFLLNMFIQFLSGRIFPLDILPKLFASTLLILPTSYLIYIPLQIYLGKFSWGQIGLHVGMMFIWIVIFRLLVQFFWRKGLKVYGAYGR